MDKTSFGKMNILLCFILWTSQLFVTVLGITAPDRFCDREDDCLEYPWASPNPSCVENECRCREGSCLIYTTTGNGIAFYCGTCGVIGSECNETNSCKQIPMFCLSDNFCHCDKGDVYRELCVIYEPVTTSFTSDILIVILVALLVILRVIKSWERIKSLFCSRCTNTESEESTVVGVNPRSGEKSAAYTITNSAFMVTTHDSDYEWALELSRQLSNPAEEWLSMRSLTMSSAASSSSRSRNRFHANQTSLEVVSEPGPSGLREEQRDNLSLNISATPSSVESHLTSNTYPSRRPSTAPTPFRRLSSLSFLQSRKSSSASTGSFHSAESSSVKRNNVTRTSSGASSIISRDFTPDRSTRSFSNSTQPGNISGDSVRSYKSQNSTTSTASTLTSFNSSSPRRPSVSSETNASCSLSGDSPGNISSRHPSHRQFVESSVKSDCSSMTSTPESQLKTSDYKENLSIPYQDADKNMKH